MLSSTLTAQYNSPSPRSFEAKPNQSRCAIVGGDGTGDIEALLGITQWPWLD